MNFLQFHRWVALADEALIKAGFREKNDFFDQGVHEIEQTIRSRLGISRDDRIPWGTCLFTEENRLFNELCDDVDEKLGQTLLRTVQCRLRVARCLISTLLKKMESNSSIELITDSYMICVVALSGFHLTLKQNNIKDGLCNPSDEVLVPLFLDIQLADLLDLLQQTCDDRGN